jgi:outer membrane protein
MKSKYPSRFILTLAACLVGCLATNTAFAYEARDLFVRVGLANVSPDETSDGIAIPALGITPIAGTGAEVDLNNQLGLTVNYMLSSSFGVELLASTPFTHDVTANLNGYAAGLKVAAGSVKQLPPTLSVVYYPMGNSSSAWQPYAGLGVNYTIFFKEKTNTELEALTGTLAGAAGPVPLDLKVDNSVGLAWQVGLDYKMTDKWSLNGAVRWIDIKTDAVFTSSLGDTIRVNNIDLSPVVYQLSVGYTY